MRFSDASSRLTVAGAEPSFNRSVLYRSTDVAVMSMARSAEHGIESRQSRRFEIAQALPPVVDVVGDDEIAEVVGDVLREDDLAAKRIGHALLEELRGIRSIGVLRRLTHRAIEADAR